MSRLERWAKIFAVVTVFSIPISTSATSVLFPLTALLSLVAGSWDRRFALLRDNRVAQGFLVFFAVYLLGAVYSIAPSKDIVHELIKHSWILLTPLLMPLFVEEKWRRYAINSFLLAMLITLILSYAKYFQLITLHLNNTDKSSVFKDYIGQSFFMSIAFCCAVFRWKNTVSKIRWAYLVFALFALGNVIFLSSGRTGYFVLFALLLYCFLFFYRSPKGLLLGALSVILIAGLATQLSHNFTVRSHLAVSNIQSYTPTNHETSLGIRIAVQKFAVHLFMSKPVFGYGTGSITTLYNETQGSPYFGKNAVHDVISIYLNLAVEFGLLGVAIFLAIIFIQIKSLALLNKESQFLASCVIIAILIGGLVNSWLTDFAMAHFYGIFMALTFSNLKGEKNAEN